jgi:hypothetical protein
LRKQFKELDRPETNRLGSDRSESYFCQICYKHFIGGLRGGIGRKFWLNIHEDDSGAMNTESKWDDVYLFRCGHGFHTACLLWTCGQSEPPQCLICENATTSGTLVTMSMPQQAKGKQKEMNYSEKVQRQLQSQYLFVALTSTPSMVRILT